MLARTPLPTLLSQPLVAFTIELDNEFERQMGPSRQGLWLVSLVMWSNCMRFVSAEGISVKELEDVARTKTNWNGMERWGYILVEPDPKDIRPKPPRSRWLVRATAKGRKAQETWRPLFDEIEARWQTRFGPEEIARPRESLLTVLSQMDLDLPECLPILVYGLYSKGGPKARALPQNAAVIRACLRRRFFPVSCLPSRWNSKASRNCRSPSAPTLSECSMKKEFASATCLF